MEETKHKFIKQFESVLLANLISVSYGAFLGWPSVTFLTKEGISIPIMTGLMTNIERGTLCIGGILGTISFYFLADRIGARKCLLCLTIPAMVIKTCSLILYIETTRLVGGFTGALLAILPIFATEICETKVRGTLGTLVVPSINIGMLMAYSLGNYLSNEVAEVLLAPYPLLFVYFFSKLPDTPYFDIKCGNLAYANKSLRFYRNTKNDEDFAVEFNQLIEQHPEADKPLSLQDFNNRVARKALLIGSVLMLLTPLCGALALMNYTQIIFKASGCDISVTLSSIIMRIIQLAGSLVPLILVDYAGRKVLLIISAIGAGISLVSFGIHSYLTSSGFDLQAYHWVPITSFAFFIFMSSWGMVTLPFLIVSEIMPPKIRNGGGLFCVLMFWLGTLTTVMLIDEMDEFLGTHNVFFLFASCCFLGAVFILFVVPETKGKSLEEISLIL